jgi:hypothetical protein
MKTAAVVIAFATLACSGTSEPKAKSYVGSYALVTLNGGGLPGIYATTATARGSIVTAALVLRDDASFTETFNTQTTVLATGVTTPFAYSDNGTYSVTGTTITFTLPAQGSTQAFSYTGAISDGVVTYTYSGNAYRYQKVQ